MSSRVTPIGTAINRHPDPQAESNPLDALVERERKDVIDVHRGLVRRMVRSLPTLERLVITWRFGIDCDPLSASVIAQRLNMSRKAVYNIEQRALGMLRDDPRLPSLRAA